MPRESSLSNALPLPDELILRITVASNLSKTLETIIYIIFTFLLACITFLFLYFCGSLLPSPPALQFSVNYCFFDRVHNVCQVNKEQNFIQLL